MHNPEIERIRGAFAEYDAQGLYRSRWSLDNPANRVALAERRALGHRLLRAALGARCPTRILEVGCGTGEELRWCGDVFIECQPQLVGVDLLVGRLTDARLGGGQYVCANGGELCVDRECVDVVLAITVFSSILDDGMATSTAREIDRVLRPGGVILWYDTRYRNPRNPNTRPYPLPHIRALFPGYALSRRTVTVLPPLMRRMGRAASPLNRLLNPIRALRTHYMVLLTKPALPRR